MQLFWISCWGFVGDATDHHKPNEMESLINRDYQPPDSSTNFDSQSMAVVAVGAPKVKNSKSWRLRDFLAE
jgi:hypothetical protein